MFSPLCWKCWNYFPLCVCVGVCTDKRVCCVQAFWAALAFLPSSLTASSNFTQGLFLPQTSTECEQSVSSTAGSFSQTESSKTRRHRDTSSRGEGFCLRHEECPSEGTAGSGQVQHQYDIGKNAFRSTRKGPGPGLIGGFSHPNYLPKLHSFQ